MRPSCAPAPPPIREAVAAAADALVAAERPVIYAGQGVHWAEAYDELATLAELLAAPSATSLAGKSAFDETHRLALGAGGAAVPGPLRHFLDRADLILGIGCSFSETAFGVRMPPGKKIIHATLDPADLNKSRDLRAGAGRRCEADARGADRGLPRATAAGAATRPGRAARSQTVEAEWMAAWLPLLTSDETPLNPYRVLWDLQQTVDVANTIITHDAGSPRDQLSPFWKTTSPLSYIGWGKSTQLGYGLGLIMGAKLACPDRLCINVWGDAAIGFTGMDFETAVRERIPILSILLNNSAMAIELDQMPVATERFRSTDISGDYAAFARALGGHGERVTAPDEIVPGDPPRHRRDRGGNARLDRVHHRHRNASIAAVTQGRMSATAAETIVDPAAPPRSDWTLRSTCTLGFLCLISVFNYLDRSILGLALPMIKVEMQASDTALGLVSGLAFVLFYAILGVPIAWAADRWNRRNIIAAGLAFWSLMTALTGFVANIWQLALARFLMGAGEACCMPPSNSIISDLFRKARRPLALAMFGTANSIAFIALFPIAGWIAENYGWRTMFVAAGAPGLVLALLFYSDGEGAGAGRVRRTAGASRAGTGPRDSPLPRRVADLPAHPRRRHLHGREHLRRERMDADFPRPRARPQHERGRGVDRSDTGPARRRRHSRRRLRDRPAGAPGTPRWRIRLPALACILAGPAEALFLLGDPQWLWLLGFAMTSFFTLLHQGPIYAATMEVARLRMRAIAIAVLIFCASLLGQAVGPLAVGVLNDALAASLGVEAIRYSLLIIALTPILAGLCFWAAANHYVADMERAGNG